MLDKSSKLTDFDSSLLDSYYKAVSDIVHFDSYAFMEELKERYPEQIAFFLKVGTLRKKVRANIEALKDLNVPLYFGTLTFDCVKDKNKEKTKRRESFLFLNKLFLYFLAVEEYGEENGRYHIHFVGAFRAGKGFEDFRLWHSRQNLEKVNSIDGVCRYLIKYVSKQLPRLRRNKNLVALEKLHSKCVRVRKMWCYDAVNNSFEKQLKEMKSNVFLLDVFEI